jgi:hypothetical protein
MPEIEDIYIADECNATAESFTQIGAAYRSDCEVEGQELLTGARQFTVREIEVFELSG